MPIRPINGLQMHFEHLLPTENSKVSDVPVLLLSGMASDSASWQPVITGLNKHHELLIPDNRCTGRTHPNPIETNRDLMVADILGLLDCLAVEQVNIVGHSMGGMLGWTLATQAPERVSRLITASALPSVIPARIALFESLTALRKDDNEAHWFELLYQFLFSPDFFNNMTVVKAAVSASQDYPYKQGKEAFSYQVNGLKSFQSSLDLARARCPITMITGSNDILMTPDMLMQFAADHPTVSTRVIEKAAHAIHWEQADQFTAVVLEALSATGASSPHSIMK